MSRIAFALAFLLLGGVAVAQIGLVVDGRDVPGVTSTLVSGASYAPAGELVAAVGAEMFVDGSGRSVTLTLGGRFLVVPVVDVTEVGSAGPATLDGAPVPAGPAVRDGVEIYLPVKGVVEAFGGTVAYLAEENRVVGVLPRGDVLDASLERASGVERLRLQVSAPVPYSVFRNDAIATVQVRIARASLARARTLEGESIVRADLIPGRGIVDLRVQLAPGSRATVSTLPSGRGFVLLVDVRPSEDAEVEPASVPQIVIDPGHGGEDAGLSFGAAGREGELTWRFAELLADALRGRRAEVALTRRGSEPATVAARSAAGVGADLFVSVHAADLPAGQFRVYFLGEAETEIGLEFAIRENAAREVAETTTDEVRRQILLDLVPDLGTGRRYALALENELFQIGGYRAADRVAAPLAVLTGAAGRGVMLEFAPEDLSSPALADALAAALMSIVGSGGFP